MTHLLNKGFVLILIASGLSACLRDTSPPLQRSALLPASLLAAADSSEPPFGNTATNIRRIQQKPYAGKIRFVVMGDNRNSSPFSTGGNKVYAKVIETVNQLKPDFVVNMGDFTFDALKPHWATFEQITSQVKVPYLTVVGNHDILFGRSYYETRYTRPNPETGLDDYSFDYGNSRFIMLDTANYNLTERQFQWLERQYQTPLKKFTFTHTPPKYGVWNHKLAPDPAVSARFMALNEKYRVDHVFLGHIHLYDRRVINGVPYVVSGGAGAPLDKKDGYGVGQYHVSLVDVEGEHVKEQMIPVQTRVRTYGPTTYSDGLEAHQMTEEIIKRFPSDYIPPEEQANDR